MSPSSFRASLRPLDSVEIAPSGDGSSLRLKVKPGAREDDVTGVHGGALKISVRAVAEKGRANDAVAGLLARGMKLPQAAVTIVSGGGSRDKAVRISGLDPEEVRRRLAGAWAILTGFHGGRKT